MTLWSSIFAYVAVGCVLVVAGAFRSMLDDAVGPSKIFAMRMTQAIAGASGSVVNIKIFLFRLIVYSMVVMIWPFAIYAEWAMRNEPVGGGGEHSGNPPPSMQFIANQNNLIRRYSIEEVESEHTIDDPEGRVPNVPFGFMNDRWNSLKSGWMPGDELWSFSTSDESWAHLTGRAGFAVVRNGEVVDEIVSLMN